MTTVHPASPRPCVHCPWRTANQGKRHPGHWYSKANLRRLWSKLRRGDDMTCHPTDPLMEVPDGVAPAPETARTTVCTGSLVLKQREFMRYQHIMHEHPDWGAAQTHREYRRQHPRGLTLDGLRRVLEQSIFGGSVLSPGAKMTRPNLNLPGIGHPDLVPWDPSKEGKR